MYFSSVSKADIKSEIKKTMIINNIFASKDLNLIGNFLKESANIPNKQLANNISSKNLVELNGSATSVLKYIVIETTANTKSLKFL